MLYHRPGSAESDPFQFDTKSNRNCRSSRQIGRGSTLSQGSEKPEASGSASALYVFRSSIQDTDLAGNAGTAPPVPPSISQYGQQRATPQRHTSLGAKTTQKPYVYVDLFDVDGEDSSGLKSTWPVGMSQELPAKSLRQKAPKNSPGMLRTKAPALSPPSTVQTLAPATLKTQCYSTHARSTGPSRPQVAPATTNRTSCGVGREPGTGYSLASEGCQQDSCSSMDSTYSNASKSWQSSILAQFPLPPDSGPPKRNLPPVPPPKSLPSTQQSASMSIATSNTSFEVMTKVPPQETPLSIQDRPALLTHMHCFQRMDKRSEYLETVAQDLHTVIMKQQATIDKLVLGLASQGSDL